MREMRNIGRVQIMFPRRHVNQPHSERPRLRHQHKHGEPRNALCTFYRGGRCAECAGNHKADRQRESLLLDSSLVENVALRGAGARRGLMPWRALRETTASIVKTYNVLASGVDSSARALSGGNQQKLVLGRELNEAPTALVVENPSRGLDFRATAAVRESLRRARDAGAAVVVYSSDLDEVLLLADRVYAMHDGVLTESPRNRESVGRAMLGSAQSRL